MEFLVDPYNGNDFGGNAIVYTLNPSYPEHYSISGNLMNKFNLPVQNANVYVDYYSSLRGKYFNVNTSLSDNNGNYLNSCIQNSLTYRVDPSGCLHYDPPEAQVTINNADVQNLNFINGRGQYEYFIDGHVKCEAGIGSPNVGIYINGILADTTEVENGFYKITSLCRGNYPLTPYKTGCSFDPSTMNVYVNKNKYDKDFKIYYSINGTVYKFNGQPLEGATITILENGKTATSDLNGNYSISGLNCGNYTIKVSKEGIVFEQSQKQVSISTDAIFDLDFREAAMYTISGNIFYNGNPIIYSSNRVTGVQIYINGNNSGKSTNSDGHYSTDYLYPGTYKIEPVYHDSKGYRWSFNPPYQMVTITNSNVENINFEVKTFEITGWITLEGTYNCLFNNENVYLSIYLDNKFATNSLLTGNPCEYFIYGIPNGSYYITGRNPNDSTHHCIYPAGHSAIIQDGSVHDRNFAVYIGNIEGYVKEIIHDKDTDDQDGDGDPSKETKYIEGAKVEILEKNQYDYTDTNGHYGFSNIASNWYNLKATKTITFPDGETYTTTYNPNPRSVHLCIADALNQNFYMHLYVLDKPPMQAIKPINLDMDLSTTTFVAASADYWTEAQANVNGYAEIPLPQGIYRVYALKQCNTFYPPYLTITVSEFQQVPTQYFTISGWSICDRCYATLYTEQQDCMNRIDKDECLLGAKLRFRNCISLKTTQANSNLYNAIVLSIQVNRSTGKPEEFVETFTVEQEGDYFVNVTNGDYFNKGTAVSSAKINIEGIGEVFGPSDFNKNVFHLKKQIHLAPGQYQISSILRSQPDSYLTIVISNRDISSFIELP